jgi:hypothetical protein
VIAGRAGKGAFVDPAPILSFHVAQDEPSLAAEEGLMGTGRHQKRPVLERILKSLARNQAQDMGSIVNDADIMDPANLRKLLDGLWKEKQALPHDEDLRFDLLDQIYCLLHIDMVAVLSHGEIHDVVGEFPEGSLPVMADMAAGWDGVGHHHVPRPHEAAEHCLIGVGAADGPDLAMIAFEKDLQIILQSVFDLVNKGCPPVIPFSRMPFCVPVGKIRAGLRSSPMAHHVFAGDEVDTSVPSPVLLLNQALDFPYFLFIHGTYSSLFRIWTLTTLSLDLQAKHTNLLSAKTAENLKKTGCDQARIIH